MPTMKLDFLRKFLLPKIGHTYQCRRLPVDEVDPASVCFRDIVKKIIAICRTVPKALLHLKPKQGGLGILSDFKAAMIVGLASMLDIATKSMSPQHALTKVTTALVSKEIKELQEGGAKTDMNSEVLNLKITNTQSDKARRYVEVGTSHHSSCRKYPIALVLGLLAKWNLGLVELDNGLNITHRGVVVYLKSETSKKSFPNNVPRPTSRRSFLVPKSREMVPRG